MRLGIENNEYKLFDVLLWKNLFQDAFLAAQNIKDPKIRNIAYEDLLIVSARSGQKEIVQAVLEKSNQKISYEINLKYLYFCIETGRLGEGMRQYKTIKKEHALIDSDLRKAFTSELETFLETKRKFGLEDLPKLDNLGAPKLRLQLEKYLIHLDQIAAFIHEVKEAEISNILKPKDRVQIREQLLEAIYYITDSRRMLDQPEQYPYILYMLPAADLKIYKNIFRQT